MGRGTLEHRAGPSSRSPDSDTVPATRMQSLEHRACTRSSTLHSSRQFRLFLASGITRRCPCFHPTPGLEMWTWPRNLCWTLSADFGRLSSISCWTRSHQMCLSAGFYLAYADWFSVLLTGCTQIISNL